jgi:hypothetical protein
LRDYLKRGCDDEDDNKAKICETLDEAWICCVKLVGIHPRSPTLSFAHHNNSRQSQNLYFAF